MPGTQRPRKCANTLKPDGFCSQSSFLRTCAESMVQFDRCIGVYVTAALQSAFCRCDPRPTPQNGTPYRKQEHLSCLKQGSSVFPVLSAGDASSRP